MFIQIKEWFDRHEIIFCTLLVLFFICIRLPGVNMPLHQDEYKWPMAVNPAISGIIIPHPPLGEFIYRTAGYIVGFNVHFRFVPLFFGSINLLLLYYFMKSVFGKREAAIASFCWIFSYFSVLASLMIDTDGQIMPFFFLLALIGYYKMEYSINREKIIWTGVLLLGLIGGVLVKLSFMLAIGAILADFLWSKRYIFSKKDILRYIVRIGICIFGFIVLLALSQKIFPFFDLEKSVTYWKHFFIFFDRGWFQTFIQCVKAVLYASPLLVLVPLFSVSSVKENISKLRVFLLFLLFAFVFYVVLFDFSIGALDRYLQLLILPLTVVTSVVLSHVSQISESRTKKFVGIGITVTLVLLLLQFISHSVPALYPKSEWLSRIISFKWNFLYPFSGGSGPLGFYVFFLFMALSWVLSFGAVVFSFWRPHHKKLALAFLLPIAVGYNLVFMEEYLFGLINGSASKLVISSTQFIKENPSISSVMVYNDNGAANIQAVDKYARRIYATPQFENSYKDILNEFTGHILIIDIPRVDPNSFYAKYFSTCKNVYSQTDKYITATVLQCKAKNI